MSILEQDRIRHIILVAFVIISSWYSVGYSADYSSRMPGTLLRFATEYPDSLRVIYIVIEPSLEVQEAQLKRNAPPSSRYDELHYSTRSAEIENSVEIRRKREILEHYCNLAPSNATAMAGVYNNVQIGPYYLFLNAFRAVETGSQILEIAKLEFVTLIIDGDETVATSAPSMERNNRSEPWNWEGFINQWAYRDLKLSIPYRLGYQGQGKRISIIDTGILLEHPAVNIAYGDGNQFTEGYLNVVAGKYPSGYSSINDTHPDIHGTATASVVWQCAPNAEFIICRIAGQSTIQKIIDSIQFSLIESAQVINISLGVEMPSACETCTSSLCIVADAAVSQQTSVFAAGGNSEKGDTYTPSPGRATNVMAVSSYQDDNGYSLYLPGCPSEPCNEKPNVAGPGSFVSVFSQDGGYVTQIGYSSIATAYVSGIALVLGHATENMDDINQAILSTAVPIPGDVSGLGGSGRVNAKNALCEVLDDNTAPVFQEITLSGIVPSFHEYIVRYTNMPNEIYARATDNVMVSRLEIRTDGVIEEYADAFTFHDPWEILFDWNSIDRQLGLHFVSITARDMCDNEFTYNFYIDLQPPPSANLEVIPTSLDFVSTEGSENSPSQWISILNAGSGDMSWTISEDIPWLSMSSYSGVAPYNAVASVNVGPLGVGSYSGEIVIQATGALNSPQDVFVTLTIVPSSIGNTYYSVADTYLSSLYDETNFGAATFFKAGNEQFGYNKGLVKFNVSNLLGQTVHNATLRLYCTGIHNSSSVVVNRMAYDWQELTATYSNTIGGAQGVNCSRFVNSTGWKEWNVTALVRQWAVGGMPNNGFLVQGNYQVLNNTFSFSSREGNQSLRPQLVVEICEGTGNLAITAPTPDEGGTTPPFDIGQTVEWSVQVTNSGSGCVSQYRVNFYLGTTANDYSNYIGYDTNISLMPGEVHYAWTDYTFEAADVGSRYLIARIYETGFTRFYGPFTVSHSQPPGLPINLTIERAE